MSCQQHRDEVEADKVMVAAMTEQAPGSIEGYVVVAVLHNGNKVMASNACCHHHAVDQVIDLHDVAGPACTSPQASLN